MRAELRRLGRVGPFDMVFGGPVEGTRLRLTEFVGARTNGLRSLQVTAGRGLGGRVVAEARPSIVTDYGSSGKISHEYDAPVLGEGLRAVAAVPVVTGRTVRGVVYGAVRGTAELGDRAIDHLVAATRTLAGELRVHDEVERRLAQLDQRAPVTGDSALLAEIRDVNAELRALVHEVADPALRERLVASAGRLARLGMPEAADGPVLSPREIDVLTQVALGLRNEEVAQRLSLSAETVKSYLRSAAVKLGTHSRHESVHAARRLGLLA